MSKLLLAANKTAWNGCFKMPQCVMCKTGVQGNKMASSVLSTVTIRTMSFQGNKMEKTLPPRISFNYTGVKKLSEKLSWSDWIVTTNGRKTVGTAVVVFAFVVTSFSWFVNIISPFTVQITYEEKLEGARKLSYLEKIDAEEDDSVPPPPELVRIYSISGPRAGLDEVEHEKTELFTSALLDPVVIGTTHSKSGASIGFPRHMMYRSVEEVDIPSLRVKPYWNPFFKGFEIPETADPEDLASLKESLVLSPAARQFIVTKCMHRGNTYQAWTDVFLPGALILGYYVMTFRLNEQMKLFQQKRYIRLGMQSLFGTIIASLFLTVLNLNVSMPDTQSLEGVIRSAEEAEAAVEFYTKCKQRNVLLRKILGPDSNYYFLENGDVVPNFFAFQGAGSNDVYLENCKYLVDKYLAIEKKRMELDQRKSAQKSPPL